jgi:hypothetical protein
MKTQKLVWINNLYPKDFSTLSKKSCFELIKGRPRATKTYTVEELEEMGFIGVYKIIVNGKEVVKKGFPIDEKFIKKGE